MKKYDKWQRIILILCSFFILMNATACHYAAKEKEEQTVRIWTDSANRQVEVPTKIEKIALTGPLSQIVMYAFAPDMLVGISNAWSDSAKEYIPEKYLSLPEIGQLYGGKGEINFEELLTTGADIVIDIGEPKDSIVEDLDSLQEQTGIPFVHITLTLSEADQAFLKLGDLLGMEDKAEEFADYCQSVYGKMIDLTEKVQKANLLYVNGENGLFVLAKGSFHSQVIDLMSNNLAVVEDVSSKGTGNEVDMEQILNWNPDIILFAPNSIYSTVTDMPEWQSLQAIKNHTFYEVPEGPYNWLGSPPSVQRYLGMMWLATLLYPEAVDFDLQEEVTRYYDMFYHSELTDEQYRNLTAHSINKP